MLLFLEYAVLALVEQHTLSIKLWNEDPVGQRLALLPCNQEKQQAQITMQPTRAAVVKPRLAQN